MEKQLKEKFKPEPKIKKFEIQSFKAKEEQE